jgi:UDP-glucose 4-epimerase
MPNNKKILITGGAGFIGSHLAEKLLADGQEVFILDDLSTGSLENIKHLKDVHFTQGSVLDEKLVNEIVDKVDQVYHLAAAVGVKTIVERPLDSFLVNIDGTKNVLAAAAKKQIPVLITSSSEVYGKNDELPFSEEDDRVYGSIYHERWGYGLSKTSDEFLGLAYFKEKKLPVVIVRLFNVTGPRQKGAYGMVVPRFIQQALANQPFEIYGDGEQTRCFGYVKDVAGALVGLMEKQAYGRIFNVGSAEEISIKGLAEKIKELAGSQSEMKFIPYKQVYGENFDDMRHRRPDLTAIKQVINYNPQSLEETLKSIIAFWRSNPHVK